MKRVLTAAALALVAGLLPASGAGSAAADPPAPPTPPPPTAAAAGGRSAEATVTLITGDRVVLRGGAIAAIRPGPGRDQVRFHRFVLGIEQHVIPADAGRLLAAGRLDERLFNVTRLVQWKYDDASRATLPLIAKRAAAGTAARMGGAVTTRALPRAGVDAMTLDKSAAGGFWRGAVRTLGARTGSDVARLWLDGRVEPTLDRSAAQIGAPTAWQDGFTGTGVKVAVLDSGYDADHPALAGAVTAAKGFTYNGAEDVRDWVGHGTHVAATVAGRDPKYRGIAPGAELVAGKVLDDGGWGQQSWIIAGMEWAAAEQRADVVNLSLGGGDTQAEDPVEQAVDRLTAATGALFVVAAGNEGEAGDRTLDSPAGAAAALAVGAVDRDDRLAPFSSRGPRIGDRSIKPDLTAPGVGIVSAVPGGRFAALSGTSMAAPHVAGAAAVLAQQHPEWTAVDLKSALIGSTVPSPGVSEFAQGAGRIDLARAVRTPVTAVPGNLSTYLKSPHVGPVNRKVTYRNTADQTVTLQLSTPPAPFRLSVTRLSVPAGGSADVTVTIDPAAVRPGSYSTVLTATAGSTVVRTLLGAYVEPAAHQLELEVRDRSGQGADGLLLVHSQQSDYYEWVEVANGTGSLRLPDGGYNVAGLVDTGASPPERTVVHQPVQLAADQRLVIDSRRAVRPTMTVDEPTATTNGNLAVAVGYERGAARYAVAVEWDDPRLFVVPVRQRGLVYTHYRSWFKAGSDEQNPTPYRYYVADVRRGQIPVDAAYHARTADLARLTVDYRATRVGEQGGFRASLVMPGGVEVTAGGGELLLPTTVTEYLTPGRHLRWGRQVTTGQQFDFEVLDRTDDLRSYGPGAHRETWNAAVIGPALAPTCTSMQNPMPCGYREQDRLGWIGAVAFGTDAARKHRSIGFPVGSAVLTRNGVEVGRTTRESLVADNLPPEPADFVLTASYRRPTAVLTTAIEAVYRFRSGRTTSASAVPLIAVRYAAAGLDAMNRAAPGSRTKLDIWTEQYGPAVRSLQVESSTDDGTTWAPVDVRRHGRDWRAAVRNPAGGFVSLRATATDEDGNSVTQTIIRAYAVADAPASR